MGKTCPAYCFESIQTCRRLCAGLPLFLRKTTATLIIETLVLFLWNWTQLQYGSLRHVCQWIYKTMYHSHFFKQLNKGDVSLVKSCVDSPGPCWILGVSEPWYFFLPLGCSPKFHKILCPPPPVLLVSKICCSPVFLLPCYHFLRSLVTLERINALPFKAVCPRGDAYFFRSECM